MSVFHYSNYNLHKYSDKQIIVDISYAHKCIDYRAEHGCGESWIIIDEQKYDKDQFVQKNLEN